MTFTDLTSDFIKQSKSGKRFSQYKEAYFIVDKKKQIVRAFSITPCAGRAYNLKEFSFVRILVDFEKKWVVFVPTNDGNCIPLRPTGSEKSTLFRVCCSGFVSVLSEKGIQLDLSKTRFETFPVDFEGERNCFAIDLKDGY